MHYKIKCQLPLNQRKHSITEQVNKESFEKIENGLKAQMPGLLKGNPVEATFGMFTASYR